MIYRKLGLKFIAFECLWILVSFKYSLRWSVD